MVTVYVVAGDVILVKRSLGRGSGVKPEYSSVPGLFFGDDGEVRCTKAVHASACHEYIPPPPISSLTKASPIALLQNTHTQHTHTKKVSKVRDAMRRQLDCSRALCLACADLGNACSEAEVRDVVFQNTQFQLDEDLRKRLDEAIVQALDSLDNKLKPFGELDKMIQSRNSLKLDYDHYIRKVKIFFCVCVCTVGVCVFLVIL